MSKLRLSVENFGPIRRGSFELSPLTVFIGPNNTGKSYMALLAYVLCHAASSWPPSTLSLPARRLGRGFIVGLVRLEGRATWGDEARNELRQWLLRPPLPPGTELDWRRLPKKIRAMLREAVESISAATGEELDQQLREYFAVGACAELLRHGATGMGEELRILADQRRWRLPLLQVRLPTSDGTLDTTWHLPDTRAANVSLPERDFRLLAQTEPPVDLIIGFSETLVRPLWEGLMGSSGFPRGNAYYLPAARSGVLSGWPVFMSMAVELTRGRFGLEQIQVPPFGGVTGDFLQVLMWIFQHQRTSSAMGSVLEVLHGHIMQGEVSFGDQGFGPWSIVYSTVGARFPIQRTSSMVAELAPLSLWVRHVLVPGDLLVIDEPEAHLHPGAQRNIARVLVRLVRAGVRVICTTHSSLILHQLSNHLLLSQANSKERQRFGFTSDDVLNLDDVGVYLFDPRKEGVRIKAVPIDPETGIEEGEFVRVMEAIGDQTYRLSVQRDEVVG